MVVLRNTCKLPIPESLKTLNKKLAGKTAPRGEAYVLSTRIAERNEDGSQKNSRQKSHVTNPYKYPTRTPLAVRTMCQFVPRLNAVVTLSYTGNDEASLSDDLDDSSDESYGDNDAVEVDDAAEDINSTGGPTERTELDELGRAGQIMEDVAIGAQQPEDRAGSADFDIIYQAWLARLARQP